MNESAEKNQSGGIPGLRASLHWIFFYMFTHIKEFEFTQNWKRWWSRQRIRVGMHSITQRMLEGTWEELSYLLDILLSEYGTQVEATGSTDRQKISTMSQ